MRNKHQLRRYLMQEVHGIDIGRKPPARETSHLHSSPERDPDYRAWIRSLPCCACGSTKDVEAAHTGTDGGKGQKASDYSCVPLCASCHRTGPHAYHGLNSSARDFEQRHRLNFARIAAELRARWIK